MERLGCTSLTLSITIENLVTRGASSKSLVSPDPSPCGHSLRVLIFKCFYIFLISAHMCASISLMHKAVTQSPDLQQEREGWGGHLSVLLLPGLPVSLSQAPRSGTSTAGGGIWLRGHSCP